MESGQYFKGPKDQAIHTLKQEMYALQTKIGDYDVLRKNMIDLEMRYRDLLVQRADINVKHGNQYDSNNNSNANLSSQVENQKEQVHLMTLKNNQLSNQVMRQKQINHVRQDEIRKLDQECKKKDDEAIDLKRELERIQS